MKIQIKKIYLEKLKNMVTCICLKNKKYIRLKKRIKNNKQIKLIYLFKL